MEDAMLAAMAKPDADIAPTDDVRSAMAAKDVLDALDHPATARQVAERLGKSEANVLRVLNRLQTQSRVDVAGTTKTKARIWTRMAGAYHAQAGTATAHAAKTEKTRRRALMLIARPATASHVASLLGHSREYTFRVLRTLVDEGLATYDRDGKNAGLFQAVAK
jgi:DNA-binding IclR family transcriptional regulator